MRANLFVIMVSLGLLCSACTGTIRVDGGSSDLDGGSSDQDADGGGQDAGDMASDGDHADASSEDGGDSSLVEFIDEMPTLEIEVTDEANVRSDFAPVSGGIPFARGVLQTSAVPRLAIADQAGYLVAPFGASVLGTWSDGSVKWLLLDFATSMEAKQSGRFTLGLTATAQASAGISLTEEAARYVIDTGTMRVDLSRIKYGFLDSVSIQQAGGFHAVTAGPGEMFIDLDDMAPGPQDSGVYEYPDSWNRGMEGGNWLRDSQASTSTRYLASTADYAVELIRHNPAHTVFKLSGWHRQQGGSRDFGKYSLFLHFYAGQSVIRVLHTWIMTGDPKQNFVRRMAIELPLVEASGPRAYAFGGSFETPGVPVQHNTGDPAYIPLHKGPSQIHEGTLPADGSASIYSIGPDKYYHNVPLGDAPPVDYTVLVDDNTVAEGVSASGWGSVSGVAMGVRDFWREHPKEIQFDHGTMGAYIWPDHGAKTLDMRRRYDEVRGTVADGFGTAARREFNNPGSAVGVAKSTELFFYFHGGDTPGSVDNHFRRFQDPLRPFVSGAHNVATGAFGPLTAYDPQARPQIENYLDLMMARIIRSQEEYGWVGMYDYGDYLPEFEKQNWELDIPWNPNLFTNWGYAGWLQEAYRFGQWAFVQYFRSGRYRYWRAADTWLRHTRDVDCVFWEEPDDGDRPTDNRSGQRLGGGHRHDQQHWGTYMAGYGIPSIAVVHHYYMTGDPRDLDAMKDYISWNQGSGEYYERHGEYSVLYMAEALGDADAMAWATSHQETPNSGFGRGTFDSGMGLMMRDIQTGGDATIRERLRAWADLDESTASFLKAYLENVEGMGTYTARLQEDWDAFFPAAAVQSRRYEQWAVRVPADLRDAMSPDIMPNGPWDFPLRTLESIQFDGPGGMGNDLGRHSNQMSLMWHMPNR